VAASAPELVRAMCEGNRDALLDAVDDALGRLGAARGSLASTGALAATLETGHRARQAFDARHDRDDTADIDLATPGVLHQLRKVGQSGGRVVALEGTRCRVVRA
jgi:prephenate dehydrogenase